MSEEPMPRKWSIPRSWSWVLIGDVCEVVGGGTPSTTEAKNFDGGEIPWITPTDLSGYSGKYVEAGARFLTRSGLEGSGARLMPPGTVLFSSRAPIGYVAIAKKLVSTNQGFKSFVPPNGVIPEYLYYYLQHAKPLALELSSGTTFQEISGKKAARIPLALAPESEQARIVGKLEEVLSDLDAGIAALERARANLKRYRAVVLKAAVEGRLTEKWRAEHPEVEPASKLLERILVERRRKWEEAQLAKYVNKRQLPAKGWKDKYPEPGSPDLDALPKLPKTWCWATVDQLSHAIRYGTSAKTHEGEGGVPVLRMGNIQDGRFDLSSLKYLPADHDEFPGLFLEVGDILFNRTNSFELVGKTAVYKGSPTPCSYASYLIGVRPVKGWRSEILAFFLNSSFGRAWIMSVVSQQVGQANVNGSKLASLAFPLPPALEQTELMKAVEEQLSSIEQTNRDLDSLLLRATTLRQAILKRAFEGRLVPQDPNDEPASELLARIKRQREGIDAVIRKRAPKRAA